MKTYRDLIGYCLLLFVVMVLAGCAGKAIFKRYEITDGKEVLIGYTEITARNIKAKTKDGEEVDSKPFTFPTFPSTFPVAR